MKNLKKCILFMALSTLTSFSWAKSPSTFVYGVSGNFAQAQSYADSLENGIFIQDKTIMFENSNIFVKTNPGSDQKKFPYFKDVEIVSSNVIDEDKLMEICFKSFALKTNLANSISLVIDGPNLFFQNHHQSFDQLLYTSGISKICTKDKKCRQLFRKKWKKVEAPKEKILYSLYHDELSAEISKLSNIRLTKNLNFSKNKNPLIFIVLGLENPVNKTLLDLMTRVFELKSQYPLHIHLIAPYMPYARSDKSEPEFGVATQGSLVAKMLENVGIDAITVVRPHAPQSMGFFTIPNFQISGNHTINKYLGADQQKVEHIISPDAGFQKDATKYAKDLGIGVTTFNKSRDSEGVANLINNTGLQSLQNKHLAIIDDETSTGGTLSMVASEIANTVLNVKITAVVTHLAGPATKAIKDENIYELVVTNTLPIPQSVLKNKKIKVLSIAPEIALHLKNISEDL